MANIWEKAYSILAGNLNLGLSYLITTVLPEWTEMVLDYSWTSSYSLIQKNGYTFATGLLHWNSSVTSLLELELAKWT